MNGGTASARAFRPSSRLVFKDIDIMGLDLIILSIALGIVALILGWGVITMARGGAYNVKNSNRIMRYRIIFQALALIVILILMWLRQHGS
jgi:thiamine transporter ThiT